MTPNEEHALLFILGTIDGTLEPQPLTPAAGQADAQARAAYGEAGAVAVPNPGEDAAARKRFERACAALREAGHITACGKKTGLPEAGHESARRLAGLPTLSDALPLLAAIIESRDKWTDGSVSEPTLCGLAALPRGIIGKPRIPEKTASALTAHALPLLAARLIDWRSVEGFDGLFLYHPTAAGMKLAGTGNAETWFKRIRRPRQFDMPPAYCGGWQRAFTARQHARPERANLVHHQDPVDPPR
jgi:hypothetical protein